MADNFKTQMNDTTIDLTVVVPVYNEAGNIGPLVEEIRQALSGKFNFEIIYIDDGSDDATSGELWRLVNDCQELRSIRHKFRAGQSAAIATGVRHAAAPVIATLDGDGQNDPEDIPRLMEVYARESSAGSNVMVAGHRADRRDRWAKRMASQIANRVRRKFLHDMTPDTGCGLKLFARADFLGLPWFDHMHRFLPALVIRAGGRVISVDVNHRVRQRGGSKYGVFDRLWVGIIDLLGVMWLNKRRVSPEIDLSDDSRT